MKLKEVVHEEVLYGEKTIEKFNIISNRFLLFNKFDRELDKYSIARLPNYLELEVLEIKTSGYSGWGVSFPTTHIKLDFPYNRYLFDDDFYFGDYDTRS